MVEEGALALDGGVEGGGEGVVDDADGGDEVDGEAERDGDVGVAVDEVGGAVDGVDDELRRVRALSRNGGGGNGDVVRWGWASACRRACMSPLP